MDIREWRRLAGRSAGLLVLVLILGMCCFIQRYGSMGNIEHTVYAQNQEDNMPGTLPEKTRERQEAKAAGEEEAEKVSDRYIKIPKPDDGQATNVYLENDYMDFTLTLTLEGVAAENYRTADIERIYKEEVYSGAYQKKHDMVKRLHIADSRQNGTESACIRMLLKDIYEPALYETSEAYYISLEKPEDIYEHVVVIDAGHGGGDDGTVSRDGKYYEKDYTLRIVGCLQKLLEENPDIKVYYTRLSDDVVTKPKRVRLANAVHADAFVSIHCNASLPGDTSANGAEALYSSKKRAANEKLTSKQLSQHVLDRLCAVTGRKPRGIIKRNGLYLMNHSRVPVTIIEVGYMSNQSDLKYLLREKNQKEIARGIYQGITESLGNEK